MDSTGLYPTLHSHQPIPHFISKSTVRFPAHFDMAPWNWNKAPSTFSVYFLSYVPISFWSMKSIHTHTIILIFRPPCPTSSLRNLCVITCALELLMIMLTNCSMKLLIQLRFHGLPWLIHGYAENCLIYTQELSLCISNAYWARPTLEFHYHIRV